MSILKNHIQSRIRKELSNAEIIIYNPNKEEKAKIKAMLEESAKLQISAEGQLLIQTNFNEIEMFKFLVETLTNLSDDLKSLTDDEIIEITENGDDSIKEMLREFKSIIKEVSQEFVEAMTDQLDAITELFKQEETFIKLDEVLKSKNLNMQDLIALSQKQNELNELQKNQLPKPQDHLPKQSQSKKRGRPKKVKDDKVSEKVEEVKEGETNA